MQFKTRAMPFVGAAFLLGFPALALCASTTAAAVQPQLIDDSLLKAISVTVGGASVLPTTRTVAHWWGSTFDPSDGVTYGYNMVGSDPNNCAGTSCSVTVQVDVTPIVVNIDGLTFSGSEILQGTLDSPQFAANDFGSTVAATNGGFAEGAGGNLSPNDAGLPLQLEDATMRAQFNRTGPSTYHLILHPNVLPAVTINVPKNQGTLLESGRGVIFADVNVGWWSSQIQNLVAHADPTHLALYLTRDVMLYSGKSVFNCCIIGYHGTQAVGNGGGSTNSNGNAAVNTFAWASWVSPGLYARPDGGVYWALQDIHALSHEISEWADDPFVNNTVEPWVTPTAPQYGCSGLLETGDPVVGIGFAMGVNSVEQGPNPNGTQSADGFYHPEDEVMLPWFMRVAPSTSDGGRYTFMGSLNPFPGFRQPATGC